MPPFVTGFQLRDVPQVLCISLPEWHSHTSAHGLKDLVAGDKSLWREARGKVRREVQTADGHEDALQLALGVDEALGSVYEHPALGDRKRRTCG